MSRNSFIVNRHSTVCLNVKELLARSRRHIWSLRDSSRIRTHNHLARKRTLNQFDQFGQTLLILLTMLKLFHKSVQKNPIKFPKILTKTVYIRKCIRLFRFHMNPQKTFPLWITDSLRFTFRFHRTLIPIKNTL